MPNELEQFINAIAARTALEELLEWDEDLVDYLVAAWSMFPVEEDSDKEFVCALYAAQLPRDKQHFSEKLEQWLLNNYNLFTE